MMSACLNKLAEPVFLTYNISAVASNIFFLINQQATCFSSQVLVFTRKRLK